MIARGATVGALALVAAAAACGTNVTPTSGLMVTLTTDGALGADFDTIAIHVNGRAVDASKLTFPTSLGVTGAPGTKVTFEARGVKGDVLRVAALKETTIPSGRVAQLDVRLARDCVDRCVQLGPTDTLGDVCDPDALAKVASKDTCAPPRPIAVDQLPTYDPAKDPALTAGIAPPAGCDAPSAYCTPALTCASLVGTDRASGALACDAACSAVDPSTTCRDTALDTSSPWPTSGGQMSRANRSAAAGPTEAPSAPTFAQGAFAAVVPALAPDGRTAFAGGRAFDLTNLGAAPAGLADPSHAALAAAIGNVTYSKQLDSLRNNGIVDAAGAPLIGCCSDASELTLSAQGTLFGVSRWGVLFGYGDRTKPPAILWLQRDYLATLAPLCGFNCTTGGVALSGDGHVAYVGTTVGLFAVDVSKSPWTIKWGPLSLCRSLRSTPAVGADGRVYVGRVDDGICAVTPDGRAQTYESDDGVLGDVAGAPAIGVDGTAYFGTSIGTFYARGAVTSWNLNLGGPITAGAAIGDDGTLYVESGAPNRALHAVDRLGRLKWSVPLRGDVGDETSPTVDSAGHVFIGDPGGFLHALRSNGTSLWEVGVGSAFVSPLVVTPGGLLTVRGNRLVQYAVSQ